MLKPWKTHTVRLTLFPAHQKEHILVLTLFLFKIDQKGEEVPNCFNLGTVATKK